MNGRPGLHLVAMAIMSATLFATPSSTVAAEPSLPRESVATCPDRYLLDEPATLRWILDLRTWRGDLARRYDLSLNELAAACYGRTDLTITAFRTGPEGLGGIVPYYLSPAWLDTWLSSAHFLAATDLEAAPGAPAGPFLAIAVPPSLETRFAALAGRWATATLHFDDPAAVDCRVAAPGYPGLGVVPSVEDLIATCRTSPVLSSIREYRCPRPPYSFREIVSTPEIVRAHCFGDRTVEFDARGDSVQTVWLGLEIPPDVGNWWFRTRDGDVSAFVPSTVALPDPQGTPWEFREGIGGVWWRVSGHFDDLRASECSGGDSLLDGPVIDLSITRGSDEAVAFCRNHLVVDRLTWLRIPPTDLAPTAPQRAPTLPWLAVLAGLLAGLMVLLRPMPRPK